MLPMSFPLTLPKKRSIWRGSIETAIES